MDFAVRVGATKERTITVSSNQTTSFLWEGENVLSTPSMIAEMEETCRLLLKEQVLSDPEWDSVGTIVDVKHLAATPVGVEVTFRSMIVSAEGRKVLFLKEGSKESKGKEAQRNNFTAAKLIAEIVKTSLGPRGMDKMLVDSLGDVTITNDGATILKEIDVQHPAAKMMVEVAKSVDNEVGDGTTTSVVFAGALLERAEELINRSEEHTSELQSPCNLVC